MVEAEDIRWAQGIARTESGAPKPSRSMGENQAARQRLLSVPGEPLFIADWEGVLMIHYEVDSSALQQVVPLAGAMAG